MWIHTANPTIINHKNMEKVCAPPAPAETEEAQEETMMF